MIVMAPADAESCEANSVEGFVEDRIAEGAAKRILEDFGKQSVERPVLWAVKE